MAPAPGEPFVEQKMPGSGHIPAANVSASVPLGPPPPPPPPSSAPPHDPSLVKLTRGHSCVLCQQRKVRCDKNKPCANCVKAQVECRVIPPQPPRRRKKKPHERDLVDRLKRYEALLNQHGVNFEPISSEFRSADPAGGASDVDDLQSDLVGLKTSPSSSDLRRSPDQGRSNENNPYQFYKGLRETEERDSSDDEPEGKVIHNAFDNMFDSQDGFPFVVGGAIVKVTDSHPPGIQIFQLWQIYLTNVNPLLKITHTQTLQAQIIEAGANTARIPKPLEALMFSIYFIAVTSLSEDDCINTFDEDKHRLLQRYQRAAQHSLINSGFMRSSELMVLQAYLIYLISAREFIDPRSMFCLLGIAVRIAQRLGIHRDGAQFGLPPFEVELRRRLWWQLVLVDKRMAEITGSSITALSSSNGDTRWPLNINDTDLHLHAKDPPVNYHGPTEMLFNLTRIEMSTANAPDGLKPSPKNVANSNDEITKKYHYTPSANSPDVVANAASHTLPHDVDAYCNYIENAYLNTCDPKIPLHFFTLMMTRQALCKLRVIDFLTRQGPPAGPESAPQQQRSNPGSPLSDQERDALFIEAIRLVEYDNIVYSAESIRGFVWYTKAHFPLPVYMFLGGELRARRSGDLCERAWIAVTENFERRGLIQNPRSPFHFTLGGAFVKAWEAHEASELQAGRQPTTPKMITLLRQTFAKIRPPQEQQGYPPNQQQLPQQPLPQHLITPQHRATGPMMSSSGHTTVTAGTTSQPPHMGHHQAPGGGGVSTSPQAAEIVMGGGNSNMYAGQQQVGYAHQQYISPGLGEADFAGMDWSSMMSGGAGGPGFSGGDTGMFGGYGNIYGHPSFGGGGGG